jgi:hypothetical protein
MTSSGEPLTVVDIERDTTESMAAARLRRRRRRVRATVVGLAALGALAASALAPNLGGDDPARSTTSVRQPPAAPQAVPAPHGH